MYAYECRLGGIPWLFTVRIAGITIMYAGAMSYDAVINFRVILVYNLAASLVVSAPVFMVVTRYIADAINQQMSRMCHHHCWDV